MSPSEIAWRLGGVAQAMADRLRFAMGSTPEAARRTPMLIDERKPPPFRVSDVAVGEWASGAGGQESGWLTRLRAQADEIADHRLTFFDLKSHPLGNPIDWHRDHSANVPAPKIYSPAIDYRDFKVTGDCKLVWEPSRHHHLVILARAYRATGERRYAEAVAEQLDSWLRDNPFPIGMNWRSGLELGVRMINWVWAVDLIHESGVIHGDLRRRLLESVYLHCWDNSRKYSQGSSSNNHLVGEAAGVYVACAYFDEMPNAARWREESHAIVMRELLRQSHPDGCTREQAIGYQMFVLEFYLACGMVGRWRNEEFAREYWQRVEKMIEFLGLLLEGGDTLPFFGDYDDGYVLDLGRQPRDPRDLLAMGAVLFGRADFKAWAGGLREPVRWLLGKAGAEKLAAMTQAEAKPLVSRSFTSAGYYLLQSGPAQSEERISVLFDCAELGFGSIAAHGHADALSFALRAFGTDVFVDPGTYDYYTHREWRNHFRSTPAHNTVAIDGQDQSSMLGNFMWGQRADTTCLEWKPTANGGSIRAEHNGYSRLPVPAIHRRTLSLAGDERRVSIEDEVDSSGSHEIAQYFHLSEHCTLLAIEGNRCDVEVKGRRVTLLVDPKLSLTSVRGSVSPICGWISRGYHHRAPIHTLIAKGTSSGTTHFVTRIEL